MKTDVHLQLHPWRLHLPAKSLRESACAPGLKDRLRILWGPPVNVLPDMRWFLHEEFKLFEFLRPLDTL